jgi:hypothetical protein
MNPVRFKASLPPGADVALDPPLPDYPILKRKRVFCSNGRALRQF